MDIYRYAQSLYGQADLSGGTEEQITRFHRIIDGYFSEDVPREQRKLCIFCAGSYGEMLFRQLRERLVVVDFFCDNLSDKWGYLTDGVSCISPAMLAKYKDQVLVIVANKEPATIVDGLKANGYRNVIAKQELDSMIEQTPPVKWVALWQNIQDLDYSTSDAEILMRHFSQTIFDVCAYYQSKFEQMAEPERIY